MLFIRGLIQGVQDIILILKLLPFIGVVRLILRVVFGWDQDRTTVNPDTIDLTLAVLDVFIAPAPGWAEAVLGNGRTWTLHRSHRLDNPASQITIA